jgi:hypothetical protein
MAHINELTYNELSEGAIIPNDWGHLDFSVYTDYVNDEEACFKLKVWVLQCKYGELVTKYINHLSYGIKCENLLITLLKFKRGLEVLNRYNPRDISGKTTDYNTIEYSIIASILTKLNNI